MSEIVLGKRHIAAGILIIAGALFACKQSGSGTSGAASARSTGGKRDGVMVVSTGDEHASFVRNFNPLLAPNSVRFPALAGIHEPLLVYNSVKGEYVPWLATAYEWAEDNKLLRFKIRPDVKWSDGQPFTAQDVVFTFELLKKFPALDLSGVWKLIDGVRAPDPGSVEFHFKSPYVPGLYYLGGQPLVPEHVWKNVADPVTYTNAKPVATGPFTEVRVFQNQVYELGANPNYWQKGKPYIKALRFPAFPTNDAATMAIINGEVDWSANFIPDVDKVFVAKDPKHHHYWYSMVGSTVTLYPNTTKRPFDDARVRKAVSMAIDRPQIVKVAVYNYTRPADATGLSDAFKTWRSAEAVAQEDWTKLDVAKANQLLDAAGYKRGAGGIRQANGKPIGLQIIVPTGWSDYVRAVQIIVQNLKQIGLDASLKTYDFGAWFDKVQKGEFEGAVGWTQEGPTPYQFYRGHMASAMVKPLGEPAVMNWHRYGSKEADALFEQFEKTADLAEQHAIASKLQAVYAENAPSIPLHFSPVWGQYNDKRFTNFPNKENPYARLSTFPHPQYLLLLTEVRPR